MKPASHNSFVVRLASKGGNNSTAAAAAARVRQTQGYVWRLPVCT